ncbi:unnamed protein product [Phyllotreta striolata]|uniref:CBM39 domain-containing protein n=1 Tax=Phyllotreta striolata TaxID=444603 RepID=A0A9N9TV84_PHYSR|nr:unnamed protein product [Phyllotreta striolata]
MLITILLTIFAYVYANGVEYEVPRPTIKVLEPSGFRVSIPDEEGLQLFAFHGSINKPLEGLEAGRFSKDILKPTNGKWVFENYEVKLNKGDVIYYWLFVIRNHLGYRKENGVFEVGDITSASPEGSQEVDFHASSVDSSTRYRTRNDDGYEIALKVSDMAGDLYQEVKKLREINRILKELANRDAASTTLKFIGRLPAIEDAQFAAQIIITEKLRVNVPVVNASWSADKTIAFQVADLDDKIYLIRTANKTLADSQIGLEY